MIEKQEEAIDDRIVELQPLETFVLQEKPNENGSVGAL
jgi:hypothetical protein